MIESLSSSIQVDVDQQKGSIDKNASLEDYCKSETIITASGIKYFLAIVADGGGKVAPDHAAKLAVDTIFENFKKSKENDPAKLLRASLASANLAVYQLTNGDDYVGLTIIVIKQNHFFVGQVGNLSRAYLVRDNAKDAIKLISDKESEVCLGDAANTPNIYTESNIVIKRGERIILCSDGLFNPPEGKNSIGGSKEIAEKIEHEIPVVGQYDDVRGSARHLSSIAKGMDATDDITVMVLGLGRKKQGSSKIYLIASIFIAIALLIAAIVIAIQHTQSPLPQDLGVAVLMNGNSSEKDIEPEASYTADGPTHFMLATRPNAQSTDVESIQGINLYLANQTNIIFNTLNYASTIGNQATDPSLLNTTKISLTNGQILIVSDGTREYIVIIPVQASNLQLILNSGAKGVMGVSEQGPILEVDCLQGDCSLTPPKGDSISLATASKSTIDLSNSSALSSTEPIVDADWKIWDAICTGNQPVSCDLSK
jgi:serine/threonine protein phosphatase PrpC